MGVTYDFVKLSINSEVTWDRELWSLITPNTHKIILGK